MKIYLILYEMDQDNGVITQVYPVAYKDIDSAKYYIENEVKEHYPYKNKGYVWNKIKYYDYSNWNNPALIDIHEDIECETSCESRWVIQCINLK